MDTDPLGAEPSVTLFKDFPSVQSAWRALEAESEHHPFQSLDWTQCWQECVGEQAGYRPQLVLVEGRDGEPWMLLPLATRRRAASTALVWLGGAISDYHGLLISPRCPSRWIGTEGFRSLWKKVVELLPPFDYAHLDRQLAEIGGRPNPILLLGCHRAPSSAHMTQLRPDWDTYYKSKTSSRTRQTHRRKARRLADLGDLTLEVTKGLPATDEVLEAMFEQKSASYQRLGVRDLFAEENHRHFVRTVTTHSPDMVHLSSLRLDGRVIATHWGLLHQNRLYYLLPTYEQGETANWSPGEILRLWLLEWSFGHGVTHFDFTLGEDSYKRQWAETSVPLYFHVKAHTLRGWLFVRTTHAMTVLKERIKASRTLYPLAMRWRARLFGSSRPSTLEN